MLARATLYLMDKFWVLEVSSGQVPAAAMAHQKSLTVAEGKRGKLEILYWIYWNILKYILNIYWNSIYWKWRRRFHHVGNSNLDTVDEEGTWGSITLRKKHRNVNFNILLAGGTWQNLPLTSCSSLCFWHFIIWSNPLEVLTNIHGWT